jgi:hypothetical protein
MLVMDSHEPGFPDITQRFEGALCRIVRISALSRASRYSQYLHLIHPSDS